MKNGLVLEGGAMRGMFTAGVLDVFMEQGICFDGAVGVSAGAVFGCNLKSLQIGRTLRYNLKYCRSWRYAGVRSWLTSGDVYNVAFDYDEIPNRLDPFDKKTFRENAMEFYVVATDARTGKPVYHRCEDGEERDLLWMRASASMPGACRVVEFDGLALSDGGTGDSVPLRFFEQMGYGHSVVILTQPAGYRKTRNRALPALRIALRHYPNLIRALEGRHEQYNRTLAYVHGREKAGKILVIRPPEKLTIPAVCRDRSEIQRVYNLGRREAESRLEEVKAFLTLNN